MNIDLTRAQASAISKVLHEYLCEGGAIPGVDNDDVAEAFRTLDIAAHYTASVKLKPSPMVEAARASIERFNAAMDGDSSDAELDAALEMRDHLAAIISSPATLAASDLLAALAAVMTWWTHTSAPVGDDEMPAAIFDAANAVIAKATA